MYLALSQDHVGSPVIWICGFCWAKMPIDLVQKSACFLSPRCETRSVPLTWEVVAGVAAGSPPQPAMARAAGPEESAAGSDLGNQSIVARAATPEYPQRAPNARSTHTPRRHTPRHGLGGVSSVGSPGWPAMRAKCVRFCARMCV